MLQPLLACSWTRSEQEDWRAPLLHRGICFSSCDTIKCKPKGKSQTETLLWPTQRQLCSSNDWPKFPSLCGPLPHTAEPCHSSVQLSSTGGCPAPAPACAIMTPNYQGREHDISFITETRSPRCCLSPSGLSPCLSLPQGHRLPSGQFWHLHLGKGREGKASLGDTESVVFPAKCMSHLRNAQPVSARDTGSQRSAHTLLEESQPK